MHWLRTKNIQSWLAITSMFLSSPASLLSNSGVSFTGSLICSLTYLESNVLLVTIGFGIAMILSDETGAGGGRGEVSNGVGRAFCMSAPVIPSTNFQRHLHHRRCCLLCWHVEFPRIYPFSKQNMDQLCVLVFKQFWSETITLLQFFPMILPSLWVFCYFPISFLQFCPGFEVNLLAKRLDCPACSDANISSINSNSTKNKALWYW